MKVVIQRSGLSEVWVDKKCHAAIHFGSVILVCFEKGDHSEQVIKAAHRMASLRYFEDPETGKMNRSISEVQGEFLVVSQFTLSWDGQKGLRPSFDGSLAPAEARILFKIFCDSLRESAPVKTGVFGAMMDLRIQNQGPVTFHLSF